MTAENPYAPPQAAVDDVPEAGPAPALWNPNAAASWSLLFSPIFGALLHMKNWQAMGEPRKAAASKAWALAGVGFLVLTLVASFVAPESQGVDLLGRFGGFVMLIAWYYAIGKSQATLVAARYGKAYPRRGWLQPLLLAVAAFIAFITLAAAAGFVIGLRASGVATP